MEVSASEPTHGPHVPLSTLNRHPSPSPHPLSFAPTDSQHLLSPLPVSTLPSRPGHPPLETRHHSDPPSHIPSPRASLKTPRPMTSQGMSTGNTDGAQPLGLAVPRSPDSNRPLNVTDALSYLDAVKMQFQDKPDVYNHFLDIMKDFKSQVIDTPGVIERVSMLFHGNPYLIQGFNTFLPPGYRIELSTDPRSLDTITVTTPMGTITQSMSAYGAPVRVPREMLPMPGILAPFPQPPPFAAPPVLPVGIGSGSRPATPSRLLGHSIPDYVYSPSMMLSPPLANSQATAAASFLGNLGNRAPDGIPAGEFNHAIQFLNKIKVRFEDDPETYKQFLEILHAYQKEQKHLHDSQVFAQVQMLFKDAPDLMSEFRDFLPEALAPSSHHSGLVGILPHPTGGASPWSQAEVAAPTSDKATKAPSRRRKRAVEKEAPGTQKGPGGRIVKRAKPNQKPEPQSPKFAPFPVPSTPPPPHVQQSLGIPPHLQNVHSRMLQPPAIALNGSGAPVSTSEELLFFDRAKKALESGGTYDEFLKLLNLFAKDVIDAKTLVDRVEIFLGEGELMAQFKDMMSWDDKYGNIEYGPPGSIRTGPPDPYTARPPDDGQGPSYRRFPESEIRLACSGRGQLEWSVLNDEWVSHPTWASEESGFVAHKKNSFEDTLHKSEEERHEYQVHIEGLQRTIGVLEPLDARIDEMSPEERTQFRLKPSLGGTCPAIYERTIKKIYGRDNVAEIMKALQECPSVAVPVVLKRLKQKDVEWRRAQREWSKTWREVDAKNFYKALDHQGIIFKANDKKCITTKHFVQDIESVKALQTKAHDKKGKGMQDSFGYQLEYELQDTGVLQDSLKLIFSFLDRSPSMYSPAERRSVERFLRSFIPMVFMISPHELNIACGPLEPGHDDDPADDFTSLADGPDSKSGRDRGGKRQASGGHSSGVSPGDLRKRLLKTAQERSPRSGTKPLSSKSAVLTRSTSPAPSDSPLTSSRPRGSRLQHELDLDSKQRTIPADIWVREALIGSSDTAGEGLIARRPFFANTTYYTLLRLLQLLYSRLSMCKDIGARLAEQKHSSLLANPIAVELGLDEPNGPAAVLSQAVEVVGGSQTGEESNVLYLYLLDACEKVFDNESDQATFEEHLRWFFGTKAYHVFTLDRIIIAVVKQVQTITADNKCQELWDLLQRSRGEDAPTVHDTIRYRREAEHHVGLDDNLYRFDWDADSRHLRIQLVGSTDPSVGEDVSRRGRWKEYVASYVMEHPTEWLPAGRAGGSSLFLKRTVMDAVEKGEVVQTTTGMRIVVEAGSYKLQYEAGGEDVVVRRRERKEETALRSRAAARREDGRRWIGRLVVGA
ncbi:uncharacterized protein FIBRA_00086 [Fibroporia radiculosa]|uniref:Histone deacetylase interacting domain-containing protein n=1 Tax=Fibroporia radiculosa TaxID=599839 RepID=J7RG56_9APHY|nr:uncharacterized protein FIBRA_00086 [Fibroporia radiculosa]CCL98092.1 predicted protein [Fibroporia radiculosa]